MANDEQHEPDLDAIVREVGWIDHKAKRSAELAYEQARAHYEPIVAELRERVEALELQLVNDVQAYARTIDRIDSALKLTTCPLEETATAVEEQARRAEAQGELVLRAVKYTKNTKSTTRPRWSCVCDVFHIGSANARELCRAAGLDPDESIDGPKNDSQERVETLQQKLSESIAREEQLEAQLRHEEKRRAELDSENASLSTESDQVWLRATAAEDRVKELEAQLSRGVFVREMSDEEILSVFRQGIYENHTSDPDRTDIAGARACIAAATKLPEGAVRWSEDASVRDRVVYDSEDRPIEGIEADVADSVGVIHHVYVPEVTGG